MINIAPGSIALIEPALQQTLSLDEGLKSPFAENILREMDRDGKVGLKNAEDAILDEARKRTNGYPRALEAFFAILSVDRETSLEEILADTKQPLPEHVVEKIVGEAFNRLDAGAQIVMQTRAINRDGGYLKRVRRLFGKIFEVDEGMLLNDLRMVVERE